jgi:formylmethanofuran dehydrogenase subunit E
VNIASLLKKSSESHSHLCPRQILGVRMGLAGLNALGFAEPPCRKELLIISETDGCFADGLSAASQCTVGHRTLRVEDYGKVAATFVETRTGRAVRIAPAPDIRLHALVYAPNEPRHYFAQMEAYQVMPGEVMFSLRPVTLKTPVARIISRPGLRVNCEACGEEIMNEREVLQNGMILCLACAQGGYCEPERELAMAFNPQGAAVPSL